MILPALKIIDNYRFGKMTFVQALLAPVLLCVAFASNSTESAIANGETRTINLSDSHTNEAGAFTYMVNGVYDSAVLEKLNWFMRDWRHDEKITMDPKLFDIVWEVYRESGSSQPVDVLSGYRSPETNAMLRRRSRQVAEHSQHMLGKAMDAHFLDVPTAKIRDIAMRLEAGGVGFYPTGNTPWVHLDAGSVRYWPRMSHDQIARLFPDGKTVFIPSDGVPLPGYQQAAAEIEARGGAVYAASSEGGPQSLLAMLFGGGGEDDAEEGSARGSALIASSAPTGGRGGGGGSAQAFLTSQQYQVASGAPDAISKAKRDLPRGETYMTAPDAPQKPQLVASVDQPAASEAAADSPIAATAERIAPVPPRRPSGFAAPESDLASAPTPPARPIEFALVEGPMPSAPQTRSLAPIVADAAHKNDQIGAMLGGKLPGVITRGAGGAMPATALALTEVQDSAARPTPLVRAAALTASLPASSAQLLPPLARAALLSAPLPPPRQAQKTLLVAARIDRTNFTVMTAAPAKTASADSVDHIVPPTPGAHPELLMVAMLTPSVQAPMGFASHPYGDLRSDAFTGSAVRPLPLDDVEGGVVILRGSSN
jgi:uncharacterized protein YcbK (DUF882 family)